MLEVKAECKTGCVTVLNLFSLVTESTLRLLLHKNVNKNG